MLQMFSISNKYCSFEFSIDPFSVSKHCDVFLWAELSWRLKLNFNFNRRNQIGRPAHAFTQRVDDLTELLL